MIYYELTIATEDGEDWIDLVGVDEIDEVVDNWHDYDSPARLLSVQAMSKSEVEYALSWHHSPGASFDDIVNSCIDFF